MINFSVIDQSPVIKSIIMKNRRFSAFENIGLTLISLKKNTQHFVTVLINFAIYQQPCATYASFGGEGSHMYKSRPDLF